MATNRWIGTTDAFSLAANWSLGTAPANGEDVVISNSSQSILTGLAQEAVVLTSLTIDQSFTGYVGTATSPLVIGSPLVNIGLTAGITTPAGSTRINLDLHDTGDTASTVNVYNSASTSADTNLRPIRIKQIGASVLNVYKGKVSVCEVPGTTSVVATVNMGYVTNQSTDADVYIGVGATVTTINKTGGNLMLMVAATTVTNAGGSMKTYGSGAITTANVSAGTAELNSSGTITTLNAFGTGTADLSKSATARTVTTAKVDKGSKIKYDPAVITMTNKVQPYVASGVLTLSGS